MHVVLAATITKLLKFKTLGHRLFVLGRRVILFLALSALQCDDFPHCVFLTSFVFYSK